MLHKNMRFEESINSANNVIEFLLKQFPQKQSTLFILFALE